MIPVIDILKANRSMIIAELKEAFFFKSVELKVLMNDFVSYLNEEDYNESYLANTKDIKWAIDGFRKAKEDNYHSDLVKCQNHNNEQIEDAKKFIS